MYKFTIRTNLNYIRIHIIECYPTFKQTLNTFSHKATIRMTLNYILIHVGQFFHFQYIQSMLFDIPSKKHLFPTSINLAISFLFGDIKYLFEKTETNALKIFFILNHVVLSLILTYLSIRFITSYAGILNYYSHLLKGRQY